MEMCSELFQSTCIDFSRILFVANAVLHKSMIAIQYDSKAFRVFGFIKSLSSWKSLL